MDRAEVEDEAQFPAGLRVLVVDDDVTCLRVLKQMLLSCRYEVTTCSQATMALTLLRESKDGFHLVLSDVHMPDMDGFKLLELVGLEMDLPVIMMSADARTNIVMKGIKHGACDYLIKPVRMEELKNIWQHVVRKKRTDNNRDVEYSGSFEEGDRVIPNNNANINNSNNNNNSNKRTAEDVEYASSVNDGGAPDGSGGWKSSSLKKKRCTVKEEEEGETESADPSSSKKPRVVWSVELHQQFVNAVNQLGIEKAVPKRILELMNVPGLTRENVASHLQKFRLYLKRLSGVTQHHPGLPNPFCGPVSTNIKGGPLGRLDFETLVASGHIPPQALAAFEEELFTQNGSKQPVREIAFGQPLVKCGPPTTLARQFPQSNLSNITVNPSLDMPSSFSSWPSNNDFAQIMHHQQQQQQQQQVVSSLVSVPQPTTSLNVQPSCLVIPSSQQMNTYQQSDNTILASQSKSQGSGFQTGSSSVLQSPMMLPSQALPSLQRVGPAGQNYQMNQGSSIMTSQPSISGNSSYASAGSVVDYNNSPISSQPKNLRFGVGQIVDEGLKPMTPVSNNNSFSMPGMMSGMANSGFGVSGALMSDNNRQGRRNNLGFVGKGTCLPSRFAVDEIESPTNLPNFSQIGGDFVNPENFGLDGQI